MKEVAKNSRFPEGVKSSDQRRKKINEGFYHSQTQGPNEDFVFYLYSVLYGMRANISIEELKAFQPMKFEKLQDNFGKPEFYSDEFGPNQELFDAKHYNEVTVMIKDAIREKEEVEKIRQQTISMSNKDYRGQHMEGLYLSKSFLLSERFEDSSELINKIKTEDENSLGDFIKNGMFDDEINEIGELPIQIPLLFAIQQGKIALAKKILARIDGEYFLKRNNNSETILHVAVKNDILKAIELILKHIQTWDLNLKNEIINTEDKFGRNFMHYLFISKIQNPYAFLKTIAKYFKVSQFFSLISNQDKNNLSMIAYAIQSPDISNIFFKFIHQLLDRVFPEGYKVTQSQLGIKSEKDFQTLMNYNRG